MNNSKVQSKTIGECWLSSIQKVLKSGKPHLDEDIEIRELLGLTIKIEQPEHDDHIIDKLGDPNVVSGTLDKFAQGINMPDKPFTYSDRIYNANGVNQFEWMVNRLQNKSETKSATICLLLPGDTSANIPCLTTIDAKIRDKKLQLHFFYRSQNIFGRQYANLLALARFQNQLATVCDVDIGQLYGYIASAHIYKFDYDQAEKIINGNKQRIVDQYYLQGPRSIRVIEQSAKVSSP